MLESQSSTAQLCCHTPCPHKLPYPYKAPSITSKKMLVFAEMGSILIPKANVTHKMPATTAQELADINVLESFDIKLYFSCCFFTDVQLGL